MQWICTQYLHIDVYVCLRLRANKKARPRQNSMHPNKWPRIIKHDAFERRKKHTHCKSTAQPPVNALNSPLNQNRNSTPIWNQFDEFWWEKLNDFQQKITCNLWNRHISLIRDSQTRENWWYKYNNAKK